MSYQIEFSTPRCPIALGTSFAEEAARLGRDALGVLRQEKRERLLRMGSAKRALAPTPILQLTSEIEAPAPEDDREDDGWLIGPVPPEAFFAARRCRAEGMINTEWIIAEVCLHYGFARHDLVSKRVDGLFPVARQVGYWLTKQLIPGKSAPEIARKFGKSDHCAIFFGISKVNEDISKGGRRAGPALAIRALIERRANPRRPQLAMEKPKPWGHGRYSSDIIALLRANPSTARQIARVLSISTCSAAAALGSLVGYGAAAHAGTVESIAPSGKKFQCNVYRVAR